jgi:hypothetical protein
LAIGVVAAEKPRGPHCGGGAGYIGADIGEPAKPRGQSIPFRVFTHRLRSWRFVAAYRWRLSGCGRPRLKKLVPF